MPILTFRISFFPVITLWVWELSFCCSSDTQRMISKVWVSSISALRPEEKLLGHSCSAWAGSLDFWAYFLFSTLFSDIRNNQPTLCFSLVWQKSVRYHRDGQTFRSSPLISVWLGVYNGYVLCIFIARSCQRLSLFCWK